MKIRGDSQFCHTTDSPVEHIPAACHDKPDVFGFLQHFVGCFYEIFRTFLESDSSQERDNFFRHAACDLPLLTCTEINGIVNGYHLFRINMVTVYNGVAREMTHGYHFVCRFHTSFFKVINLCIYVFP